VDTKSVLVVEDDENCRNIWAAILDHHGYRVLEATDGEAGVRVTREQRPDLILMDLVLPRLNGWSAAEWIKREPGTAQIPLVALTVRASGADRERADALGFASYLAMPRSSTHVLAEVERLIGPAKPGTGRRKTPPGDEAIRWQ
jgi:CheY-like chemotaxis protein